MAVYYYVCATPNCGRNKKGHYVREETVRSRGHSTCLECGKPMVRHRRAIKGPNTKRSIPTPTTSTVRLGSKPVRPKGTNRKRLYKR